jgi:predicted dehydrogenase
MEDSKIHLGVVGAGFIGRVHLEAFKTFADVELYGVCDTDRRAAEEAAALYGVREVFRDADRLFSSNGVDAVILGVPNYLHADMCIKALEAGKHVLLEKPMGANGSEALRIARAKMKSRGVLMIGHHMRWHGLNRQVKALVDKGELGRIYNAGAGMWRRKSVPGWGSWFTRKSESGGGALVDIGVHMLDLGREPRAGVGFRYDLLGIRPAESRYWKLGHTGLGGLFRCGRPGNGAG